MDFEAPDLEGNKVRMFGYYQRERLPLLIYGLPGVCLVGQRRKR